MSDMKTSVKVEQENELRMILTMLTWRSDFILLYLFGWLERQGGGWAEEQYYPRGPYAIQPK